MYKQLSAPLRAKYDAAVEGAIATYKSGWLDELRMAKKRRSNQPRTAGWKRVSGSPMPARL